MKYTIIKSKKQYFEYCSRIELLGEIKKKSKDINEEIELLQLLIDKYDSEQLKSNPIPPHELLKGLMLEHNMKGIDLAQLLQVSPGLVSDMLNGKKAFSKNSIRILSNHFRVKQEAFNSELHNWKTSGFIPTT
jgi:HTH-type transcriptional regulator/antitoxin HigA